VEDFSDKEWKALRTSMIKEYDAMQGLPPPLNLVCHAVDIARSAGRKLEQLCPAPFCRAALAAIKPLRWVGRKLEPLCPAVLWRWAGAVILLVEPKAEDDMPKWGFTPSRQAHNYGGLAPVASHIVPELRAKTQANLHKPGEGGEEDDDKKE
jgi:hypothetical protein